MEKKRKVQSFLQWTYIQLNNAVGTDDDDEEAEPFSPTQERKESALASKRLAKDGPVAKLKKKQRVLVEVIFNVLISFVKSVT